MIEATTPNPLDTVRRKTVRSVARSQGPAAEALFNKAAGARKDWTRQDWNDVLASLDTCDDRIGDWLAIRE